MLDASVLVDNARGAAPAGAAERIGNTEPAYQPAATTATITAAADTTMRGDDMPRSFESCTMRVNRCRRRANAGAGRTPSASANASSASIYAFRFPVARTV